MRDPLHLQCNGHGELKYLNQLVLFSEAYHFACEFVGVEGQGESIRCKICNKQTKVSA